MGTRLFGSIPMDTPIIGTGLGMEMFAADDGRDLSAPGDVRGGDYPRRQDLQKLLRDNSVEGRSKLSRKDDMKSALQSAGISW